MPAPFKNYRTPVVITGGPREGASGAIAFQFPLPDYATRAFVWFPGLPHPRDYAPVKVSDMRAANVVEQLEIAAAIREANARFEREAIQRENEANAPPEF